MRQRNKIELIGIYGSDEIIACSAWTSTSRNLTNDKRNRIPKMLEDLWKNGHETPFEKGIVHFLVDSEIASHIHMLKHRISSINGESARYKELKEDKYYLPEDWIGIYPKEPNTLNEYFKGDWFHILEKYTELGNKLYHQCLSELTPVLGRKRAKESARFFKTYNSQIEVDIMFNMRSFANFLNLRKSEEAQKEIRDIATEMYNLLKDREEFKYTLNIITKYKPKKLKDV